MGMVTEKIGDFFGFIKRIIFRLLFSTESFPIVLAISIISILFVLIRMKSVEQDYLYHDLGKEISRAKFKNKELKAIQAKYHSVKNLRKLAKRYHLQEPKQEQIILIP